MKNVRARPFVLTALLVDKGFIEPGRSYLEDGKNIPIVNTVKSYLVFFNILDFQ